MSKALHIGMRNATVTIAIAKHACRDCATANILMDAKALYPKGFHPMSHNRLPDAQDSAPILPRSTAYITYYYVDFGISTFIPHDSPTRMVTGVFGRDQEVPELSGEIPYDPFKVDVFILANVFTEFMAVGV